VPIEVTMPKLSPTMERGVITQWLVKVGDQIKEGDVLADVETDKATMQMKSYDDGIVVHIDRAVGDEVTLGQRVLVLAKKGEDPKAVAASLGVAEGQEQAPAEAPAPAPSGGERPAATPGPEEANRPHPEESATTPTHPEEIGTVRNGQKRHPAPAHEVAAAPGGRIKSTPLARKIAAAEQVDLAQVPGSGPGGRVTRSDVESFLSTRGAAKPAPAAPPRPAARPVATPTAPTERIPHTRMRKTIANRMVEAKKTAPDIHLTVDIRVDALVAIREQLNKQLAAEDVKLSLGDFVTKAVALALRRHPGVNATFEPDAIVRHGEVNIGIAVALDSGLIVPVLQNADQLGLREIRVQSEALAQAARNNKLTPEQMTGGTFTISNLGMYGIRAFDAIINLPEVAILAVGAAEKRPIVVGDSLTVGTLMTVTLTADHRAVDGAMAAEFLRTLKGLLEEPASMLL
jgi:pyruvate dehydrogenase E2 component (dihydrolipoamide acetyltransferase)